MEDLLNRVLNPILGRFLANKEKPNLKLNFLKGRGVMRNLVFNTEEINKLLHDAPVSNYPMSNPCQRELFQVFDVCCVRFSCILAAFRSCI